MAGTEKAVLNGVVGLVLPRDTPGPKNDSLLRVIGDSAGGAGIDDDWPRSLDGVTAGV